MNNIKSSLMELNAGVAATLSDTTYTVRSQRRDATYTLKAIRLLHLETRAVEVAERSG